MVTMATKKVTETYNGENIVRGIGSLVLIKTASILQVFRADDKTQSNSASICLLLAEIF